MKWSGAVISLDKLVSETMSKTLERPCYWTKSARFTFVSSFDCQLRDQRKQWTSGVNEHGPVVYTVNPNWRCLDIETISSWVSKMWWSLTVRRLFVSLNSLNPVPLIQQLRWCLSTAQFCLVAVTSCAARSPPQHAPAPPWLLTFWPWSRCVSRMWHEVPLCKVSSSPAMSLTW